MKKIFYVLVCCSFIFVECKKNNNNTLKGKTYPINFNVSLFTQTINPITVNSIQNQPEVNKITTFALSGLIDNLTYCVYDASGKLLHRVQSTTTASNFGTINDSLEPGNYTIAIIGGKNGIVVNDTQFTYNTRQWQDAFFKKFPITITNSNLTMDVTLNRVVTQLELNITDAPVISPAQLYVELDGEVSAYSILNDAPTGDGVSEEYSINAKPNPVFTLINTHVPLSMKVAITKTSDDFRFIYGITLQKDTKTIVSGNFFTAGNGNAFNITLNEAFAADTIKKGF